MRLHIFVTMLSAAFMNISAGALNPAGADTRTAIVLTTNERDYVRAGMREHLNQVQSIVDALASDDMDRAKIAALSAGSKHFSQQTDHPPELASKWPEAWKLLLRARLQSFDALAKGLQDSESKSQSLQILSTALQTCAGCHAAYRLAAAQE